MNAVSIYNIPALLNYLVVVLHRPCEKYFCVCVYRFFSVKLQILCNLIKSSKLTLIGTLSNHFVLQPNYRECTLTLLVTLTFFLKYNKNG
jgi:hypothetical protein